MKPIHTLTHIYTYRYYAYIHSIRKLFLSFHLMLVLYVLTDDKRFCKNPLLTYLRTYLFPHGVNISDNPEVFQQITRILVNEEVIIIKAWISHKIMVEYITYCFFGSTGSKCKWSINWAVRSSSWSFWEGYHISYSFCLSTIKVKKHSYVTGMSLNFSSQIAQTLSKNVNVAINRLSERCWDLLDVFDIKNIFQIVKKFCQRCNI